MKSFVCLEVFWLKHLVDFPLKCSECSANIQCESVQKFRYGVWNGFASANLDLMGVLESVGRKNLNEHFV